MEIQTTYKDIWKISFPIILAGIGEAIIIVTDTVFLGRVGIVELGAIALADAIYFMFMVLSLSLSEGIQIIIARRTGEKNYEEIGNVFNQSLYMLCILGFVLFIILKFLSPYFIDIIVNSENIKTAVNDFLQIMAFGILFGSFNLAYDALYIGMSRTRILITATVILAIINIILDYCLIFGNFGFPVMEIKGAALASVIAEISAFLFLTFYTLKNLNIKKYGLFVFKKWNNPLFKKILNISNPLIFQNLIETARWFLFFVIIEQIGENALARANIIYSSYIFFLVPIDGFAETANTMVSNIIGQGKSGKIG